MTNRERNLSLINSYVIKMTSLPTTVTKVLEICNSPQALPADLNRVISLDPVLMARVLKLINSAYYSLPQKITSLVRAIIMLGINTVKNLALSTAVLGNFRKENSEALDIQEFWRHSLSVGVAAKVIARKKNVDAKLLEEYFISGLLHDIGKLPMNYRFTQDYKNILNKALQQQQPLWKIETQSFEMNHTDAGLAIAEAWKLGDTISDAIAFHHSIDEYNGEHKNLVYTVVFANYYINMMGMGSAGDKYPAGIETVMEYLGIDGDYFESIEDDVNKEVEKAKIFLQLAQ